MWNVKVKLIPVIVWVTGAISESLRQYLSNIPVIVWAAGTISESLRQYLNNILGKREIKELQKASHIRHCKQTVASAGVKVQNINTCVSYTLSNTTVILVGVLFYHGYMFRRHIGPSSGYSGGLHCYYQSIYIFIITITLEAYTVIINLFIFPL
jgi:hypothetical protein